MFTHIVIKYQLQNLPVRINIMPVYLSDQARLLESYDITPFPKFPASRKGEGRVKWEIQSDIHSFKFR